MKFCGHFLLVAILTVLTSAGVTGQTKAGSTSDGVKQYDLSVKVGNTIYVVLYTPPAGSKSVEYSAGMDRPVLIEGNTMKVSDMRGETQTMPILSRHAVPAVKSK